MTVDHHFYMLPAHSFSNKLLEEIKYLKMKKKKEENGSNPITPRSDQEVIYPQIVNANH